MNIPESNMCLYLEHVFFFLSPLEKSFKTALQSAFQEKERFPWWDFNFLSLCSGHLVHPPCCALPVSPAMPPPASHTFAGSAGGDPVPPALLSQDVAIGGGTKDLQQLIQENGFGVIGPLTPIPNCCE